MALGSAVRVCSRPVSAVRVPKAAFDPYVNSRGHRKNSSGFKLGHQAFFQPKFAFRTRVFLLYQFDRVLVGRGPHPVRTYDLLALVQAI